MYWRSNVYSERLQSNQMLEQALEQEEDFCKMMMHQKSALVHRTSLQEAQLNDLQAYNGVDDHKISFEQLLECSAFKLKGAEF